MKNSNVCGEASAINHREIDDFYLIRRLVSRNIRVLKEARRAPFSNINKSV